jgi:hypothetical protein
MHTALKSAFLVVAATFTVAASAANASTLLTVTSYDMPNGYGTASGGGGDYWDTTYSNCGVNNCTTDGAALSGGNGLLTDGVIPAESYDSGAGVGAYVGWLTNPTITFHFASAETINEVKLYVDNSTIGGIGAPDSVTINGTPYTDAGWAGMTGPQTIDITGLALSGSDITLAIDRSSDPNLFWLFVSEAQFLGPSPAATPLPAAWSMMLIGMAGLGVASWRRRNVARPAFA